MNGKFTDSELLAKLASEMETDFYTFGAFSDYNGMNVKDIKNPIFNK